MLVELGTSRTHEQVGDGLIPVGDGGPAVVYYRIPDDVREADDVAHYGVDGDANIAEMAQHLLVTGGSMVTHLPGHEALVNVFKTWNVHSSEPPTWVWSDNEVLAEQLAGLWSCPVGRPADFEMTHVTQYGGIVCPRGVAPSSISPVLSNTDAGRNLRWQQMFGFAASGGLLGVTGTATATSATSLTGGTESGPTHATNDATGMIIVASNGVYGVVVTNTSGTTPVYTVDRWYTWQTPGGTAATTPGSTTTYSLVTGGAPSLFMGLSANSSAVVNGDINLAGEITTAGGGLIAKICTITHAAGGTTGTIAATFTANGSDSLPVTIAKIRIGPSLLSTLEAMFLTLLGTTAVISLSGDQLTVTDTVTI